MFSRSDKDFEFIKKEYRFEESLDFTEFICPPKSMTGNMSGAAVFMQHLESLMYRISGYRRCKNENIEALYKKTKMEVPTFDSYADACMDLGYVKNCRKAYFNDVDTLKFYLREYKSVPVELLLTDSTMNAHGYEILEKGEPVEGYTKGFVVCRMTPEGVLVQNTLGEKCGALGFNFIPTDAFKDLFIKGVAFTVEEDND